MGSAREDVAGSGAGSAAGTAGIEKEDSPHARDEHLPSVPGVEDLGVQPSASRNLRNSARTLRVTGSSTVSSELGSVLITGPGFDSCPGG